MELSDYKDRHPSTLSGGQKQRVAICAALGVEKEFMFCYEPTSGLDFIGMNRLCKFIKKYAETASATFFMTYDYELVMGSCTHVLHLKRRNNEDFYELEESGNRKIILFELNHRIRVVRC